MINYDQKDEVITREGGAIVLVYNRFDINLDKFDEYYYNQAKDVITSLEMERLIDAAGPTGGKVVRRAMASIEGYRVYPVRWLP